MAYWGGAGMNFIGGATAADRKEFLETYDAWLAANGRAARGVKGVYVPRAYVPKPPRVYKRGEKKGQTIVRKVLTDEQKAARLNNLALARAAKASGNLKPYTYSPFVNVPRQRTAKQIAATEKLVKRNRAKSAAKSALSGILGNIKY